MIPLAKGVRILKQDINGLLALYKPTSVLSHPNEDYSSLKPGKQSVIKGPYDGHGEYFSVQLATDDVKKQTNARIWLINRLDMATSGIILASTNQAVSDSVKNQLKLRNVKKFYSAIVFNQNIAANLKVRTQTWINDISVNKTDNHIRTNHGNGTNSVTAETIVQVKRSQNKNNSKDIQNGHPPLVLLDLEPRTGYSHQLRFQAAQHGYPIVGDDIYGDFRGNKKLKANFQGHQLNYLSPEQLEDLTVDPIKTHINTRNPPARNYFNRLFLHCRKMDLSYELEGKIYDFSVECPVPRLFDAVYQGVR